jgi:hypothetical protein
MLQHITHNSDVVYTRRIQRPGKDTYHMHIHVHGDPFQQGSLSWSYANDTSSCISVKGDALRTTPCISIDWYVRDTDIRINESPVKCCNLNTDAYLPEVLINSVRHMVSVQFSCFLKNRNMLICDIERTPQATYRISPLDYILCDGDGFCGLLIKDISQNNIQEK